MVQEENGIDRREVRLHEPLPDGRVRLSVRSRHRDYPADIVVHPVVRLAFEHAEPGQTAVLDRFRACEGDEIGRPQRRC